MKIYRETYIRQAEIAQLIILNKLYSQRGSRDLIFQGGTALRWCYGGHRFSEDIDFVTPLDMETVKALLLGAFKNIENVMIPHFGVGTVQLTEKTSRADSYKCFLDFQPQKLREKISIKIEVEGLLAGRLPHCQNHILSALPAVSYLIAAGDFRVPRPNAVIVAETPEEILSDKVRFLLERRYLKGRDLYDVWYLRTSLNAAVNINMVENKFTMYRAHFTARRSIDYFSSPSNERNTAMRDAIEQDLSRFLPPDVLTFHKSKGYTAFINAVESLFRELKDNKVSLP